MPVWVASLVGGLLTIVGSVVGRGMLALGVGYVAYTGLSALVGSLKSQVIQQFGSLPVNIIGILSVTKCDVAISILFSAIGVRLLLNGLQSDTIKKMVLK